MKKQLICLTLILLFCVALAACEQPEPPHAHTYSTEWSQDLYEHWHAADCEHTELEADREEHTYMASVDIEETCTESGLHTLTCSVCGYGTQITVPAAHRTEPHEGKAPTCTEAGWKAYETCARCDYTTYEEIPAPGHQFEDGVCTVCGDEEPPPHECVGVRWEVTQEATCEESGVKTQYCACGKPTATATILAEHDLVYHDAKSPTCTEDGWKAYQTCTRCPMTNKQILSAKHNIVQQVARAATCTEVGWDDYEKCLGCDYTTYVEIPAKNHRFETTWTRSAKQHFKRCLNEGCTETREVAEHSFNTDKKCTVCEYEKIPSTGFVFWEAGSTYTLADIGDCTDADVIVPSTYNGKPVTRINRSVFYNKTYITSIEIPDSVTVIEDASFADCTALESVILPKNLESIGANLFSGCTSLEEITLPEGITHIGAEAFSRCTKLKEIEIPGSVKTIDNNAFGNCSSLTKVTLNEGLETLYGFFRCTALKTIRIPASVTKIGISAFRASNLETIEFADPVGWKAGSNKISKSSLENSSYAAQLLQDPDLYMYMQWTKG
ncbi:MAG: leucine-rich repeat domain-containing protein [Clostridia bacterium]|nr:leucine-rich repeat domain-containing protein [Clostridia bacterium]